MTYTIRSLVQADIEADSFWPLLWDAAGVDADALIWVREVELPSLEVIGAVSGAEVCGFAAYAIEPARIHLKYLAVADAHRGRGLGTRLVAAVRQARLTRPFAAETDDDAVGFYRALGFTVTAAPRDPRWPGRQRYACTAPALGDSADPLTGTLASYAGNSLKYAARTTEEPAPLVDALVRLVPAGSHVLELGSGTGRDADALQSQGLEIERTDGAKPFVVLQHAAGHPARLLDVRDDDFGGPYDAVFANAVLHHVPHPRLADVLRTARRAVRPGGVIAASFTRGDGDEWTERKLDAPRYLAYWSPEELTEVFAAAGWSDITTWTFISPRSGREWIGVTARNAQEARP